MSAILAVIQKDRVHVMADGAFYDPGTGVLTGADCKVRAIPGVNAVYSSRGTEAAFPLFEQVCREFDFATFDDVVSALPGALEAHDALLAEIGAAGSEVVVAGWSEARNRPEVYARQSHREDTSLQRGVCYKWDAGMIAFGVELEGLPDPADFVPDDAIAAFQRGREVACDLHCGEHETPNIGYSIGGGIFHIEIGPDGHHAGSILHYWPDVIGEPIDPFLRGSLGTDEPKYASGA